MSLAGAMGEIAINKIRARLVKLTADNRKDRAPSDLARPRRRQLRVEAALEDIHRLAKEAIERKGE